MEDSSDEKVCLLHLLIPQEVLLIIFEFAAPRDCLRIILRLVCKGWNELARLEKYRWSEAIPSLLSCKDLFFDNTEAYFHPRPRPFPIGVMCDAACEGQEDLFPYLSTFTAGESYWKTTILLCAIANGHLERWSHSLDRYSKKIAVCVAALGGHQKLFFSLIKQLGMNSIDVNFLYSCKIPTCIILSGNLSMEEEWIKNTISPGSLKEEESTSYEGWFESTGMFVPIKKNPILVERRVVAKVMLHGSNSFVTMFMKYGFDTDFREDQGELLLEIARELQNAILCKCVLDVGVKIPKNIQENLAVIGNVDILEVFQEEIKKEWEKSHLQEEE